MSFRNLGISTDVGCMELYPDFGKVFAGKFIGRKVVLQNSLAAQPGQDVFEDVERAVGIVLVGIFRMLLLLAGHCAQADPGMLQKEDIDLGPGDLAHLEIKYRKNIGRVQMQKYARNE